MSDDCNDAQITLSKLRQGAILLTFANGYLCKPPLLKKIGREMDRALEALPGQIESLKSSFPGKVSGDVETDPLLDKLSRRVKQLRNADAEISARCSRGDLGQELGIAIAELNSAVNTISGQVEGRSEGFPQDGGLTAHLVRGTQFVSGLTRRVMIVLLPLVAIAAVLFGYLFFTMEGDREIRGQIAVLEAKINSSRTILEELERQRDQISRRMDSMSGKELPRAEKIEMIDLGQELQGVRERQFRAEVEIQSCRDKIADLKAKLQEVERKSFMDRLLRQ